MPAAAAAAAADTQQYASPSPLWSSRSSTVAAICPQPNNLNLRRYRSAIALNNVGVLLLERQCYVQAVETLKHASAMLQSSASQSSASSSSSRGDSSERHVNRSLQHLSHPRPAKSAVLLMESLLSTSDGSLIQGDSELTDASVLDSILEGAPSSYMAFPIRLEDCVSLTNLNSSLNSNKNSNSSLNSNSFCTQDALVSHNLSIALLCTAKSAFEKHNATEELTRRLLGGAIRFAQRSLSFWMQQLTDNSSSSLSELYCFAIASLNSLIQVLQESSSYAVDQAIPCYDLLAQLRCSALEQQSNTMCFLWDRDHTPSIRHGPAAAA
jgi:hypothetical protein